MRMSRAHVYIRGKVQGVFFRASTKDQASMLGLKGWVKNCLDGDVEAVFEGEKAAVDNIVNWCKKGPSGAFVANTNVLWEKYTGEFTEFSIVF